MTLPHPSAHFKVVVQPPAERDVDSICAFVAERSVDAARRLLRSLLDAMATLEEMPRRNPVIPEQKLFDRELRHLRFAGYRIIYWIDGNLVRVVHVRHSARRPIRRGDLSVDE